MPGDSHLDVDEVTLTKMRCGEVRPAARRRPALQPRSLQRLCADAVAAHFDHLVGAAADEALWFRDRGGSPVKYLLSPLPRLDDGAVAAVVAALLEGLTPRHLQYLIQPHLGRLDLSAVGPRLRDAHLEPLQAGRCSGLRGLSLCGGRQLGARAIAAALRGAAGPALGEVDLFGCVRCGGGALHVLGRAAAGMHALRAARIVAVDDAALLAVAAGCAGLRVLDVSFTSCGDRGVRALLPRLAQLCAMGTEVSDAVWAGTGQAVLPLEALELAVTAVGDGTAAALVARAPRLRWLNLSGTALSADGAAVAASLPLLESLAIEGPPRALPLPRSAALVELRIGPGDVPLTAVAERCPGLRVLHVAGGCIGCAQPAVLPRLGHLELKGCRFAAAAEGVLLDPGLALAPWAAHMPALQRLNLSESALADAGAAALAEALVAAALPLHTLQACRSCLGFDGAAELAAALLRICEPHGHCASLWLEGCPNISRRDSRELAQQWLDVRWS